MPKPFNLKQVIHKAGFRGQAAKEMYGIVMAESRGNPRAYNGKGRDRSYGLAQINMLGDMGVQRAKQFKLSDYDDLYDPLTNLRAAYRISSGGKNFKPWTTYVNGLHKQYLSSYPGPEADPVASIGDTPGVDPRDRRQQRQMAGTGFDHRAMALKSLRALTQGSYDPQEGLDEIIQLRRQRQAAPPEPEAAPAATRQPQSARGAKAGLAPQLKPGKGWGGSQAIAETFRDLGVQHGLGVMSEKRDTRNTASGGVSDHWVGSKNAYAFDLSNGSQPTPEMDRAARAIMASLGIEYDGQSELVRNVSVNGYRVQVLYRTNVGGNHFDHIHVGVRKE